jgi:prepilin-type N-terminal cleavage/methylation domain-containing protein
MCNYKETSGFSLLELVIVIAIIAIFSSIATFQFNQWNKKGQVEAQIKKMATDTSEVRVRALTMKQRHSITLDKYSYTFKSYSTETWSSNADLLAHGTVIPGGRHTVKYGLKKSASATSTSVDYAGTSSDILEIDERGMLSNATNATVFLGSAAKTTSAAVNCLTIHTTRVNVGKENDSSGVGVCDDK